MEIRHKQESHKYQNFRTWRMTCLVSARAAVRQSLFPWCKCFTRIYSTAARLNYSLRRPHTPPYGNRRQADKHYSAMPKNINWQKNWCGRTTSARQNKTFALFGVGTRVLQYFCKGQSVDECVYDKALHEKLKTFTSRPHANTQKASRRLELISQAPRYGFHHLSKQKSTENKTIMRILGLVVVFRNLRGSECVYYVLGIRKTSWIFNYI